MTGIKDRHVRPAIITTVAVVGAGAEIVIHAAFSLGSLVMAFALFDFKTPGRVTGAGYVSTGALAAVFLLQGVCELIPSASLAHLAFQVPWQQVIGR